MPEESTSRSGAKAEELHEQDSPDAQRSATEGTGEAEAQVIFDERMALFMTPLLESCKREHVPVAVAIVYDPKIPEEPLIFTRGGTYPVARALASLLRRMKTVIDQELQT